MDGKSRVVFGGFAKQGIVLDKGSGRGKGLGDGSVKSWQRNGDWLCPNMNCRNINFAFRIICNLCGAARPTSASGTSVDGGRSQTVTVRMTMDDLEKWYQFKGMKQGDKKICEAAAVSADRSGAPWLIDSGASRHMASSYKDFMKYLPNSKGESVKLADGSTQCIKGSGTVMCTPDISLPSVLHVPSFPINLLSIYCITRELNCAAIFLPNGCIFQELGSGNRLGTGSAHDGLYYLDKEVSPSVAAVLSYSPLEEFLLQHRRLGHMPFAILGQLYPDLFTKIRTTKQGGEKGVENNHTTSREIVVGVIPREDIHEDRNVGPTEAEQGTSGDAPRWPKPNEEQEVRVYSRRHRAENDQVQGQEDTPLGQNPEDQVHLDSHSSSSSPSASDGSEDVPSMERCHAGGNGST